MTERDIFLAALDIEDDDARTAFLLEQCGDDAELLARVQGLISSHESQSRFLNTPAVEQIAENAEAAGAPTQQMSHGAIDGEPLQDAPSSEATIISDHNDADDEIPLGFLSPSDREDSLGRLKHYEILEVIGRGAFGIVLKAFDENLQRIVAIKVLAPEMAATSPARKRFKREATSSAKVRHENVVAIYAVEDDPLPYLVMEYIPGETLQQRLDATGPLDILEVLRLGKQMADGLAAAHAQGLIHRDIKPGNILLETSINDHVKITDFGLARAADDASMTRSGVIAGTPMYMAPEQALGHKLDQRVDLFSLGSVLYQMVSGRPPFRAPSTVAVLKRVAEDTPRPIQEIIPETPDWMCNLIGHLHAKDPDDRFDSAQEVSDLLGKCLDDVQNGRTPEIAPPEDIEQKLAAKAEAPREPKHVFGRSPSQVAVIGLLLLVGLGLAEATGVTKLSNTVVRLMTGSGTLIIETNDPDVTIAIDGEQVTITGGGVNSITLSPGEYTVTASRNGKVQRELVSITRNGETKLRVSLETASEIDVNEHDVASNSQGGTARYALIFDGDKDFVETDVEDDGSTPITLEATVQISEWPGPDKHGDIVSNTHNGGVSLGIAPDGFQFSARSGKDYLRAHARRFDHYLNRPIKLAGVLEGDEIRLYLDGRQVGKRTLEEPLTSTGEDFSIGTSPGYGKPDDEHGFEFTGRISEVRISNAARYSEEYTPVDRLQADEHTIALYHFDEGRGDVLKDSSGNGNHGKIVGATWVNAERSPSNSPQPHKREFSGGEWIDVIPLIDPQLDKWKVTSKGKWNTGKNEWLKQDGELRVGDDDDKAHKLNFPLDSDWNSFEYELEVTPRDADSAFSVNIPTSRNDCPLSFGFSDQSGVTIGRHGQQENLVNDSLLKVGVRTQLRIEFRRGETDTLTVTYDDQVKKWSGNAAEIAIGDDEGYPHQRRSGLYVIGRFTFHRIRVRMLDGGTATTLRSLPMNQGSADSPPPEPSNDFDGVVCSPFFQAISRNDTAEPALKKIAESVNDPDLDVVFVGEFGSGTGRSQEYWAHGARLRVTTTRELVGRYLDQLYAAVQVAARNQEVRLTDAAKGESDGATAGFAVGYVDGDFEGEISAALQGSRAVEGSDATSWDILLTVKEWPAESPPDLMKVEYPVLENAYDADIFGCNGKLAVSHDGKLLATLGDALRIWDVEAGTQRKSFELSSATSAVFLKHDPELIAMGIPDVSIADDFPGKVLIWNYQNEALVRELPVPAGEIHSMDLSPDGKLLVIGAYVNDTGQALLWDLDTYETRVLIDKEPVSHVAFTPDGKYLITATANERGTLRLFDAATAEQVAQQKDLLSVRKFIKSLAVSPDSKRLAIAGGNWREKDGRMLLLDLPNLTFLNRIVSGETEVRAVAFSPDGRLLATGGGSGEGEVLLLDAETLKELARFTAYRPRTGVYKQIVTELSFTSDGRSVFTAADHESARLWRLPERVRGNAE